MSIESKDISTSDMVVFLEIVKQGGFAKAADALGLYLSMVSRVGKRLEDAWGGTLFYKDMRTIKLTERGKVVEKFCLDVVSRMTEAQRTIAYAENTEQGEIKISVDVGFGTAWLIPQLAFFMEKNPNIQVDVFAQEETMPKSTLMGEVDISIITMKPDHRASLRVEKLCEYPLCLYASETYLSKHGMPQTVEDLANHKLIGGPKHPYLNHKVNFQELEKAGHPRNIGVRADLGMLLLKMAQHHLGVVVLPPFLVHEVLGLRRIILRNFEEPRNQKYLVYSEALAKSRRHARFLEHLKCRASSMFL